MSRHGPLRSRGETSALVFRHTQLAQNTEQMCFRITLITYLHTACFIQKNKTKNPPHLPISGKFYFQPSLKSGSLFTLLEKEEKKKTQGPGSPAEKSLLGD